MKNKLLLTTALITATFVTSNAVAAEHINVDPAQSFDGSSYSDIEYSAEGGAFINYRNLNFTNDVSFENNKAKSGGALYNHNNEASNTVTFEKSTTFKNNSAEIGGAIVNAAIVNFENQATFSCNKATGEGGAVHNLVGATLTFKDATNFNNNTSNSFGGAIYNNGSLYFKKDATFSGNTNEKYLGGAIMNDVNGVITFDNTATFSDNVSKTGSAGALDNEGTITFNGNTSFSNNQSAKNGGAIYNWNTGTITFNGDAIFKNNISSTNSKDIYNAGIINFTGNTTLSSGITNTGTINNTGTMNINGDITLDGSITNEGTINFASGSNLTAKVDGSTVISGESGTIKGSTNLVLDGNADGKSIVLEGSKTEFKLSNNLYNIGLADDNKTYNISAKSSGEIASSIGANANQAATIATVISATETGNASFDTAANAIRTLAQTNASAAVDAATALAPETNPVTQQVQTSTLSQIFSAISSRMSGGALTSSDNGMSSGDNIFEKAAMWVKGLFNKSELDTRNGFDSDSEGLAFGFEKNINDDVKTGIAYAYTTTDIDGFLRKTDVDTHTLALYSEYKPSNWFVNGTMSYGWSDYSENKNVAGVNVNADYNAETFGLQAMTGYEMEVNGFGITPETGLRYVHIKQDGYKDSAGQNISASNSDILTGVVGAKASKTWELNNGTYITPEVRVAATYDLVNDDTSSIVTLANGSAYAVNGEALDKFGIEFGFGITAEINDEIEFSVGYEGKFREDYRDHTGMLNAKYKF